jgi:hypothetical protein
MKKYIVNVHVNKVDDNKNKTSNEFDFEFCSNNLIKDRKMAIMKAKKLLSNIDDLLEEDEVFSSFLEAKDKGFKNYNCFSITVNLVTGEEGDEYYSPIFGADEEEKYDWLEYEAMIFKKDYEVVRFTKIENLSGEMIEVISSDLDFLLN